jgi:hypothetical protein
MGIIEIDQSAKQLHLHAWIITYGNAATDALTQQIAEEIETMWNEADGRISLKGTEYQLLFFMNPWYRPDLAPEDVQGNSNPKNNYFRIEPFAHGNISYVDGLGSNTGYFLLENLFKGSTTAAHEFGHTIGLDHPEDLDYRGNGVPGIMYPRGTLVDPHFQYDPEKPAGEKGGTIYPVHRRVRQQDVDDLKINRLRFDNNTAVIGAFSSVWHDAQLPG